MAIALKVSNSLNVLVRRLCDEISDEQFGVFQPVYIVTQTDGMNNWLNYEIANHLGIAANIKFIKPNELVQKMYYSAALISEIATTRETITWHIFRVLGQRAFIDNFPAIAAYYIAENLDEAVKRIALAQKIADLFDQYIVYRPEMIRNWNNENFNQEEDWQYFLWNAIKPFIGKNKIELVDELSEAINNPDFKNRIKKRFPAVYFFGISIITSYHLHALTVISDAINISFLMVNPAPGSYWFEDRNEKYLAFLQAKNKTILPVEGNSLLLNWGKLIQNTFLLLFKNDDIINVYDELEVDVPKGNSLLKQLQLQIMENNVTESKTFTQEMILDNSIHINSCFTILREVESLYNFIIHQLHFKKEQILPAEMLVMTTDINLYTPYIRAVFDAAPTKFYYNIADQSMASDDGISAVLNELLQLREKTFTSERIARLLDFSMIRNNFKVFDIELIRHVIASANIRFGIDNEIDDETFLVSWEYGLKRIMYGIAIADESIYEAEPDHQKFFPVNLVEGATREQVISFVHFVKGLIWMLRERRLKRSVANWIVHLKEITRFFFANDTSDTQEERSLLEEKLNAYDGMISGFDEPIEFDVFVHNFSTEIEPLSSEKKFIAGGITFCSMIPMRSIPFKFVAMLGMNNNAFPRTDRTVSFDLMQLHKKRGDRNLKQSDRHLFLETLTAAQQYFYISYIGQDVGSNKTLPASIVVDELLSYISKRIQTGVDVNQMLTEQPLHSHSNRYANGQAFLYQYLGSDDRSLQNFILNEVEPITFPTKISLQDFSRALNHPVQYYYNKVLTIYFSNTEIALPEAEPFNIDKLIEWYLSSSILSDQNPDVGSWIGEEKMKGNLPLGNAGVYKANNVLNTVGEVLQLISNLKGNNQEARIDLELKLEKLTITGSLQNCYGNKNIAVCLSKNEWKYLVQAYIYYLVGNSEGIELEYYFASKAKARISKFHEMDRHTARAKLLELEKLYWNCIERIMPFSTSMKFDEKKLDLDLQQAFSKSVSTTFETVTRPCHDEYLNQAYSTGIFSETNSSGFNLFYEALILPITSVLPDHFI